MASDLDSRIAKAEEDADYFMARLKKCSEDDPKSSELLAAVTAANSRLAELQKEKNSLQQREAEAAARSGGAGSSTDQRMAGELRKMRKFLERELASLHYKGTGSSRPKSSVYRAPCMTAYNGPDFKQKENLRCLLTGLEFPSEKVRAAHIFRHEWEDRRPLNDAGLSIDGPENVIPCYETVEKALDEMRITIEPTAPATFTVRVLDAALLDPRKWVIDTPDVSMQWSELDGRIVDYGEVEFGEAGPPLSALVCSIHMQAALRKAIMYGWIEEGKYKVPKWVLKLVKGPAGLTESFLRSAAQSAQQSPTGSPTSMSETPATS